MSSELAKDISLNAIYGSLGLLQYLESQLGILNNEDSAQNLVLPYLAELKKKATGSFYEASLKIDELGTSRRLFEEREKLILSGWNLKATQVERVDSLAEIEENFLIQRSVAQRLKIVFDSLSSSQKKISFPSIKVMTLKEVLPSLWVSVLSLLSQKGIIIEYAQEIDVPNENKNLQLLRAVNFSESALWLGEGLRKTLSDRKTVAIICPQELQPELHRGLTKAGLEMSLSQSLQSTAVVELSGFIGLLALLENESSPQHLLSWLRLPVKPLHWQLAVNLAEALQNDESIDDFISKKNPVIDAEETVSEKLADLQSYFADLILKPKKITALGIPIKLIDEVCEKYLEFLKETKRLANLGGASSYALIQSFRHQLVLLTNPLISAHQLQKLVRQCFSSGAINFTQEARASLLSVVDHPRRILAPVDLLIWFGYNSSYHQSPDRHFWSHQEMNELEKKQIKFSSLLDVSKALVQEWFRALNYAQDSCLISFNTNLHGDFDFIHPSWDFLGPAKGKQREAWLLQSDVNWRESRFFSDVELKSVLPRKLPIPIQDWRVPKNLLSEKSKWSPTSIESLFRCSMQWFLDRQHCLTDGHTDVLNDATKAIGVMGHFFFEKFFAKNYNSSNSFDEKNAKVLLQGGFDDVHALKLWPSFEVQNLFNKFLHSARSFHEFLAENKLQVIANELNIEKDISSDMSLSGKIDVILGRNEKPVLVLDYKSNVRKYKKIELEEGSLQLTTYAKLLGDHKLSMGFFELMSGRLIYTGPDKFTGAQYIEMKGIDTISFLNASIEHLSELKEEINEGRLLARIDAEKEAYRPFCTSCAFSGVCGKKYELE